MKYLYHYTNLETCIEKILTSKQLRFSNMSDLNDPKESKIKIEVRNWRKNHGTSLEKFRLEFFLNRKYSNSSKVICFSIDKKVHGDIIEGYNFPRMWDRYGKKYQGVCLKINKKIFLKENEEIISYNKVIRYSNAIPSVFVDVSEQDPEKITEKDITSMVINNLDSLFFLKHSDWEGESEFRVVQINMIAKNYCSIKESLEEIILGSNFKPVYLPSIQNLIKGTTYNLSKHFFYNNGFEIAVFDGNNFIYPAKGFEKLVLSLEDNNLTSILTPLKTKPAD